MMVAFIPWLLNAWSECNNGVQLSSGAAIFFTFGERLSSQKKKKNISLFLHNLKIRNV